MAKDKISDYSATANSNTDIGGINIDEGCAPSGINDAIRTLMKQLKDWQSGSQDVYIHPAGSASVPSITTTGDTNTGLFFPAADTIALTTGGSERLRLDSSGNLGVGTSSFDSNWSPKFQVSSSATDGSGGIVIESYKPNLILKDSSASAQRRHVFADGGNLYFGYGDATITTHATLDASGNLGIGTTSPADKLHIVGGNGLVNNAQGFGARNSAANGTAALFGAAGRVDYGTSGNNAVISVASGNNILFGTLSNTEYARIDSSGYLLVGTTSNPQSDRVVIDPSMSLRSGSGVTPQINYNSSASTIEFVNRNSGGSKTFSWYYQASGAGSPATLSTSGVWTNASDARGKENISGIHYGLATVMSLTPRQYDVKSDGSHAIGFVAQEVLPVVPELVHVTQRTEDDEFYGLDYGSMTAVLVKAIQELKAIVDAQAVEIAALKGQA